MAQYFQIYPTHPQQRLIQKTVDILNKGGVIVMPTDSSYAIACHIDHKCALDSIKKIRQLSDKHHFTLVCQNLSQVSHFTKMSNNAYRLIKALTPGAFTFLLDATKEVPKRLQHVRKKTIGIRVPDNIITQRIIKTLGEPLLSTTLILPHKTEAETNPDKIKDKLGHLLDLIIDFGIIPSQSTTIIDCCASKNIEIIRQGVGIASML